MYIYICMVPAMFVRWKDMSLHVLIFLEIVVQLLSQTKWERKTPKPKSKCLVLGLGSLVYSMPLVLWIDRSGEGRGVSLLQTYFSLLRVLFLSEMLNLLTAVVSYLIYFICGIYLSVAFLSAFGLPDAWRSWNSIFGFFV